MIDKVLNSKLSQHQGPMSIALMTPLNGNETEICSASIIKVKNLYITIIYINQRAQTILHNVSAKKHECFSSYKLFPH